jgi:hypothetical protein
MGVCTCAERSFSIFVFLVCKCILVIYCSFQNKNLYQNYKKINVFACEKKYFDSLALKPLQLYVNLVGPFVAYSEHFNLVYRQLKSSDK